MEIKASGNYFRNLVRNDEIYFYMRLFVYFFFIPLGIYIIRFVFIRTFTNSMKVDNGLLTIHYTKLFRSREQSFPVSGTLLELRNYQDDIRLPSYYQLSVIVDKKTKYIADSREGFTKETFLAFMSAFSGTYLVSP